MDTLRSFAERYRVKIKNTGTELIAPGKFGEIADDYGDGHLRMRLLAVPRNSGKRNRALNARAQEAQAAGMQAHQRAEYESIWLFRPDNAAHCELAIRLIAPRRKRYVSPEQREAMARRLAATRMLPKAA